MGPPHTPLKKVKSTKRGTTKGQQTRGTKNDDGGWAQKTKEGKEVRNYDGIKNNRKKIMFLGEGSWESLADKTDCGIKRKHG